MRALVFFLTLSVLFHGTFFAQEWLLLGAGMAFLSTWTLWSLSLAPSWKTPWRDSRRELGLHISLTDGLFLGLIILSLIGLTFVVVGRQNHPTETPLKWAPLL